MELPPTAVIRQEKNKMREKRRQDMLASLTYKNFVTELIPMAIFRSVNDLDCNVVKIKVPSVITKSVSIWDIQNFLIEQYGPKGYSFTCYFNDRGYEIHVEIS